MSALQPHLDRNATFLSEFYGIPDQIMQDLAKARWITAERRIDKRCEIETLFARLSDRERHDALDDKYEIKIDVLELDPVGFQLGDIENVVHHRQQLLTGIAHGLG